MQIRIFTILLLFSVSFGAIAQERLPSSKDSLTLTEITTTDFMQSSEMGAMVWGKVACPGSGGKTEAENPDKCTILQWLVQSIKSFFTSIFGSDDDDDDDDDSGAGGGGPPANNGGNNNNNGDNWGPMPTPPPQGEGGGGPICTTCPPPPPPDPIPGEAPNTGTAIPSKDIFEPNKPALKLDTIKVRADTAKPTKIPCDSAAIKRGITATRILDSVYNTPAVKNIRDSVAIRNTEVATSIINDAPNKYDVINFTISNSDSSVIMEPSDSLHNIIAGIHSHPASKNNSPSPADIYQLAAAYLENPNFTMSYVFGADSSEWVLVISDTTAIKNFVANYPDWAVLSGNGWGSHPLSGGATFYRMFQGFLHYLNIEAKYPEEDVATYANVFMMSYFNTGISLLKKENGAFKELKSNLPVTSAKDLKVGICN